MTGNPQPCPLRVVTWNVHACVGGDGVFDPDRVASIVNGLSPDIVALQEVDSRRRGARRLDVFAFLRDRIGGHAADAKTITTPDGDYGHMIVSRWPLRRVRVHDVSVAAREPRAIIDMEALFPFGPVRVIGAHFGLQRSERKAQTRALSALIETDPEGAAIIAGDFNELRRLSATHIALSPGFKTASIAATYPSRYPIFALDRIWCRAPLSVRQSWVERAARAGSDHLPLIADLDWIRPRNYDF